MGGGGKRARVCEKMGAVTHAYIPARGYTVRRRGRRVEEGWKEGICRTSDCFPDDSASDFLVYTISRRREEEGKREEWLVQ